MKKIIFGFTIIGVFLGAFLLIEVKPKELTLGASDLPIEIQNKYEIMNNTLKAGNITIGDETKNSFVPDLKLGALDNAFIALKPDISKIALKDRSLTFDKNKIILDTPDITYKMYDVFNGFEYEIILNKKPDNNIISIPIDTAGLDFFYQPPLNKDSDPELKNLICTETDCRDNDGKVLIHRPIDVVDSYAVYYSNNKKDNHLNGQNYGTGKVFHIYRPKIIDAFGNWVWGDMNIANGLLSITIPPSFLETANYPVIVDPTLGKNSVGASTFNSPADSVKGIKITGAAGTVDSIAVYASVAVAGNYKGLLVTSSTLAITTNGISAATAVATTAGWTTSTFATPPTLSANVFFIAAVVDSTVTMYYDAGTAGDALGDNTNSYATPTDPTDSIFSNFRRSIYINYSLPASPSIPNDNNDYLRVLKNNEEN